MAKRAAKEFRKPPFFKFNVADWLSSPWVRRMSAEQRGWFLTMLAESWASEKTCYLENTAEAIELAAGLQADSDSPRAIAECERFRSSSRIVLDRFETTPDGKYIFNARLLKEFEDLIAFRLRKQKAGYRGATSKWNKAKELSGEKRNGSARQESGTAKQTETRDRDKRQETEKTSSSAASAEPIAGTLPLINGTEYQVSESEFREWEKLYPAVDTKQEFRSMKGWLIANPTKRKTPRGIKKFINGWLAREQDKGGKDQRQIGHSRTLPVSHAERRQQRITEATKRAALRSFARGAGGDADDLRGDDGGSHLALVGGVIEVPGRGGDSGDS